MDLEAHGGQGGIDEELGVGGGHLRVVVQDRQVAEVVWRLQSVYLNVFVC